MRFRSTPFPSRNGRSKPPAKRRSALPENLGGAEGGVTTRSGTRSRGLAPPPISSLVRPAHHHGPPLGQSFKNLEVLRVLPEIGRRSRRTPSRQQLPAVAIEILDLLGQDSTAVARSHCVKNPTTGIPPSLWPPPKTHTPPSSLCHQPLGAAKWFWNWSARHLIWRCTWAGGGDGTQTNTSSQQKRPSNPDFLALHSLPLRPPLSPPLRRLLRRPPRRPCR